MISPPRRDGLYPGRLPSVRAQWSNLTAPTRAATVVVPLALIGVGSAFGARAGVTAAVFVVGMVVATVVYVKNRTDRHNAAVDSGEVRVIPDPGFRGVDAGELPAELLGRLEDFGRDRRHIGRVTRFDGGWIVRQRNPRDVAVVLGDDGGWARFDPRVVTDLWAVAEYRAGRGRDG